MWVPFHLPVWGLLFFTGNFHVANVRTISTTRCGVFQFSQEFLCSERTYHFNYVPSVGLSGFHKKFSCTERTYHGHLVILGHVCTSARVCVNQSQSKPFQCETCQRSFRRSQGIARHKCVTIRPRRYQR